LGHCRLT
jgi:hypothetical protein